MRSATVLVAHGPDADAATGIGSAFFVAPGRLLTCAHVVLGRAPLWIRWHGRMVAATVLKTEPPHWPPGQPVPPPDTAVLAVEGVDGHPCVPLADADPEPDHRLYLRGFTEVRIGRLEPDGAIGWMGDIADVGGHRLYKVQGAQIAPGHSGGPVLDLDTHRVCGMAQSTLNWASDLGGHAIPISEALAAYPDEDLRADNLACLDGGLAALRAAQIGFGGLPVDVAEVLDSTRATDRVVLGLADQHVHRPVHVSDDELSEWAARQLYTRTLTELLGVLDKAGGALGGRLCEVLYAVACCLPVLDDPVVSWITPDAAEALRTEYDRDTPRLVRIGSDEPDIRRLVLQRALHQPVWVHDDLPFGAAATPDGLPEHTVAGIHAWLERDYNVRVAEWAARRPKVVEMLRKRPAMARLEPSILTDPAARAAVLGRFGGLRFLVCARTPPDLDGADDVLLDLRPPLDEFDEGLSLGMIRDRARRSGCETSAGQGGR